MEERGLALRVRPGEEDEVFADRALLGRIIRNLVHNAIRYTEAGGILVACRRRGEAMLVEVWDTGIGIPQDKLDMIWEEFYQVGAGGGRGAGLGLAIVWRLAKLLGCSVEVRSRLDKGSMFRLAIPRSAAA